MTRHSIIVFIIGVLLSIPFVYFAKIKKINRPSFPRFTSTKSNEVNVRNGPGLQYPIKLIFKQKNEPIKVVNEFEHWRKIVDIDGEEGWIHSSVLSRNRFVVVEKNNQLFSSPHKRIIAEVFAKTRCKLIKCKNAWCKLECKADKKITGWMDSKNLWGIYDDEKQ